MEFMSVLNKLPKNELVKFAQKHNTLSKIHNIHKLKKHDLIIELLMFEDEVKKIYYGEDNDKSVNEVKTARGQKIRAPPKPKDQQKLGEDINVLLREQLKVSSEILDTENISESDKLSKMRQIKDIRKKIEKLIKDLQ